MTKCIHSSVSPPASIPPVQDINLEEPKETVTQSKEDYAKFLNTLPLLEHPKSYRVECVSTLEDTNRLLPELFSTCRDGTIFGLDMEWPPSFVKGKKENKTALVQICDAKSILLIQLSQMKEFPEELSNFLKSRTKLKAGVNIRNDGRKLLKDFGIYTNGLVELDTLADVTQSEKLEVSHRRSLQALTGIFLDQHMPKGKVRMSRWDNRVLTPIQRRYAANDAYVSRKY
ncbi:ribonuclease H-like domain-containing protein [Phycomyces nitens]|nr:ribonuclease H-like domain-containing protein [Phycomyces nitens]